MTPLGRLFQIIQKQDVFTLELEELGVALLKALEETDSKRIDPFSIISFEWLKLALDGDNGKYTRIYPGSDSEYDDILFVLMEAWQWLVREVLVAQKPTHLSRSTTIMMTGPEYFVTRRGKDRIKRMTCQSQTNQLME